MRVGAPGPNGPGATQPTETTPAGATAPATTPAEATAAGEPTTGSATATPAGSPVRAEATMPAAPPESAEAPATTAPGGSVAVETPPQLEPGRSRPRPRTWQIYQRPLPGAEHSWGPPNGQMPEVVEVSEAPIDPDKTPPNGTPRMIIGAAIGTLGLVVFGLGIAARTTDVFGEDRRAGVPLIGGGLVATAIGWGLFTHGVLRRKAFLRWKEGRATVAPTIGGATLLLRF